MSRFSTAVDLTPELRRIELLTEALDSVPPELRLVPTYHKAPVRPGWNSEDTLSRNQLRSLLQSGEWIEKENGRKYYQPYNGYAVRTGGGLVVVDLDGKSAVTAARELFGGNVPKSPSWRGSKGQSLLYRLPCELADRLASLPSPIGKLKITNGCIKNEQIELLYEGKSATIPPSWHPGTDDGYQWILDFSQPIAEAPEWVCAFFEAELGRKERFKDVPFEAVDEGDVSADVIQKLLDRIDPDDRDVWIKVGYAIKKLVPDDLTGFDLWDGWSQRSSKYETGGADKIWDGLSNPRIGLNYLKRLAGVPVGGQGFKAEDGGKAGTEKTESEKRDQQIASRKLRFTQLLPTLGNDFTLTAAPGRAIEWFDGFTPTFDIDSSRTILIRGWLASGKTEAIIQSLRGMSKRQIVWFAPRNGLLRGTAERIAKAIGLPCFHYQDDVCLHKEMMLAGQPGIFMMAPDSLKPYSTGQDSGKLFDWSKAIVVLDEFSGIRKEILSKSQSLPEFERMLANAETLIAADAFLSNADCKIISSYRGSDRRILCQNPIKSPKKISWVETRTKDNKTSLTHQGISIALIDQWVAEGVKSIAIATDNLLEGKIAQKHLEARGINTLMICSETPEQNHDYLPNPDEYLQSCGIQANVITPTLQSGGDIQTPFDRGVVLASGIIQPTQILQIMGRFRQCHEWHISAPRFSQESALSFSTLDSKKIEQWGERLGEAFGDLQIPTQKETFSWGLWESLVSEIEKAFGSEYIQHLLGLYFESVEPIEVDLSKHREPWKNLRDAVKLQDADKTIKASLKHGLKLRQEKRQARYNSEVWDLKLADLHEKYPDTFINLIDRSQQPTISIGSDIELRKEVNLYSSKRMDRLKLYLIATEWSEQFGQDLQQSMRDQFTCPKSQRFRMYGTVRLFRELNLADLVKCQKSEASDDPAAETRNSEILPNVRHFCADSPKAIALWERFKSSQIRKLFPTVESIQGFWVVVNRCLSALGYQKTSGGNARIDTQTPHKNGFYSDGRQRYSNSQSRHHTGWLLMEHSGSKLFQQIFETVMNDIRDLIQREAKDRDKWRSEPDSP